MSYNVDLKPQVEELCFTRSKVGYGAGWVRDGVSADYAVCL